MKGNVWMQDRSEIEHSCRISVRRSQEASKRSVIQGSPKARNHAKTHSLITKLLPVGGSICQAPSKPRVYSSPSFNENAAVDNAPYYDCGGALPAASSCLSLPALSVGTIRSTCFGLDGSELSGIFLRLTNTIVATRPPKKTINQKKEVSRPGMMPGIRALNTQSTANMVTPATAMDRKKGRRVSAPMEPPGVYKGVKNGRRGLVGKIIRPV
jgi:hypothetical protein